MGVASGRETGRALFGRYFAVEVRPITVDLPDGGAVGVGPVWGIGVEEVQTLVGAGTEGGVADGGGAPGQGAGLTPAPVAAPALHIPYYRAEAGEVEKEVVEEDIVEAFPCPSPSSSAVAVGVEGDTASAADSSSDRIYCTVDTDLFVDIALKVPQLLALLSLLWRSLIGIRQECRSYHIFHVLLILFQVLHSVFL